MYRRNDYSSIRTVRKTDTACLVRCLTHIIFVCLIFVTLTREDENFFGLDLITSNIKRQCLRHLFISHHRSKTTPRRKKSGDNYYFTINSQYILVYLISIIPLVKYIIYLYPVNYTFGWKEFLYAALALRTGMFLRWSLHRLGISCSAS